MTQSSKPYYTANGITFGMVSVILMGMGIILLLGLTKVYVSNQVYYESREVNKLQREIAALHAEHDTLQANVEALMFKNRVLDTIFVIEG
jgi:cell division protein FtsL